MGFSAIFVFGTAVGLIFIGLIFRYDLKGEWPEFRNQLIKNNWNQLESNKSSPLEIPGGRIKQFYDQHVFLFLLIGALGFLFYAWATDLTDTAVAAILFETRIVFLVLLRQIGGKRNNEKTKTLYLGGQAYLLFGFVLIGLVFVHLSESGGSFRVSELDGMIVALIAAILDALFIDRSIKFGEIQSSTQDMKKDKQIMYSVGSVVIAYFIMGILFCLIIVIQIVFYDNSLSNYFQLNYMILIILFVLLCAPMPAIGLRWANLNTNDLAINSIRYLTPVFAFIWLALYGVSIARLDMFFAGTVIILSTNAILNARSIRTQQKDIDTEKDKFSLTFLVLSLWTVGVIVLYRDRLLGSWIDQWWWNGNTDYYSILGLSATVFILILSFRTLRLNDLKRSEEQSTLSLYRKMEVLGYDRYDLDKMKDLDKSNPGKELDDIKRVLHTAINRKSDDSEKLEEKLERAKILQELDYLVQCKSQGRSITEIVVLVLFAIMTATIALLTRPCFEDWNAFIIDSFSVLFVSTIVFLTINLFDQKRERSQPIINVSSKDTSNSWVDIWLPILGCALLVITFVVLLYGKWLGDWSWTTELFVQSNCKEGISADIISFGTRWN